MGHLKQENLSPEQKKVLEEHAKSIKALVAHPVGTPPPKKKPQGQIKYGKITRVKE